LREQLRSNFFRTAVTAFCTAQPWKALSATRQLFLR